MCFRHQSSAGRKETLQSFISDMSHQMKTPLASISMYSDLLVEGNLDAAERQEFLVRIKSGTEKLQWMMDSLIKMSRLEISAIQLNPAPTGIRQTISESISGVVALATRKNIQYGQVELRLTASSVLPTNKGITYFPENVLDPKTAWIEGQPGIKDPFVTFQFDRDIEFYGFEYIPGYAKSKEVFGTNSVPFILETVIGSRRTGFYPYTKWILTGFDPEIDERSHIMQDPHDPENYMYQYILHNPISTNSVTVRILFGAEAKYEDTGFSELHPIYGLDGQIYCGKDFASPVINLLCSGPKSARFAPSVYIPSIKANIDDVLISWHNRISSKDVIKLPSNGLSDAQKSLFFPLSESFRCFEKPGETTINSFVAFGFPECDVSYGIVQRRIYITEKK